MGTASGKHKINISRVTNARVYTEKFGIETEIFDGETIDFDVYDNFVIQIDDGYIFDRLNMDSYWGTTETYYDDTEYLDESKTRFSIMINDLDVAEIDIEGAIVLYTIENLTTTDITIDWAERDNAFNNISFYHNENEFFMGDTISVDVGKDDLIIKVDEGYYFKSGIDFNNEWGVLVEYPVTGSEFNEDLTIFTISFDELERLEVSYTYELGVTVAKREPPPVLPPVNIEGDYIGLYTLSQEKLKDFSEKMYLLAGSETVHGYLDLSAYMETIYILPFNIDDFINEISEPVKLANLSMDIESYAVNTPRPIISLGEIEIPLKYLNAYDFLNTECRVFLPYSKPLTIDSDLLIGETISIEYMFNLYSREVTINISSTKTEHIIYTDTVEIGYLIPMVQTVNYTNVSDIKYTGYNKIPYPYVEVARKEPYIVKYKATERVGKLIDETGYVEVISIDLETKANNQEQEKIKSLLNQGVNIK